MCIVGFKALWKSHRFALSKDQLNGDEAKVDENNNDYTVNQVTNDDLKDIYNFDLAIFPAKREEFLKEWLIPSDKDKVGKLRTGFIARKESGQNKDKIVGFCGTRQCVGGAWKCGPLYGNNDVVCKKLLLTSLKHANENTGKDKNLEMFVDVPLNNKAAVDLISKDLGAKKLQFGLTRMYHGDEPKSIDNKDLRDDLVFGICTAELG